MSPRARTPTTLLIAATAWMSVARVVEAQVRSLREREFAIAAVAFGSSNLRIMFRELVPNAMAPIVVAATLNVAKQTDIDHTEGLLAEEREFIQTDPYHDQLLEIFELARMDYGRMDYGILDGKVQVWEINPNPHITVADPSLLARPPSPARQWIRERVVREFEAALRAIEASRSPAQQPAIPWRGASAAS